MVDGGGQRRRLGATIEGKDGEVRRRIEIRWVNVRAGKNLGLKNGFWFFKVF